MAQYTLFARFITRPGKEQAMADFLSAGLQMASQGITTLIWFALYLTPNAFDVLDAFASRENRQAHLDGPIAKALMANAVELLASPSEIASIEVPGLKDIGTA